MYSLATDEKSWETQIKEDKTQGRGRIYIPINKLIKNISIIPGNISLMKVHMLVCTAALKVKIEHLHFHTFV